MNLSIEQIYLRIILLFPIFTLFQSHFSQVNRVLFGILVFFQVVLLFKRKVWKKFCLVLIFVSCLEIYAFFQTKLPLYSTNDVFYFPFFVVYAIYFISERDSLVASLYKERTYVKGIVIIWSILIFVSIFLSSSYYSKWGGRYFQSFTDSTFRLGSSALFILVLVYGMMVMEKNKNFFLFSFLPMFCFLAGGSRTYFVLGAALFLIIWARFVDSTKDFIISIIPVALIGGVFVLNSSIMEKFLSTMYTSESYFDKIGTITNSRTVFWLKDLEAFLNSGFVEKLLGNGFNFIYEVNNEAVGTYIWAHNDFIQLLITYGVAGLFLYVYLMTLLFRRYRLVPKFSWSIAIAVFLWLFNATFNMYYTYFCSLLSLPILLAFYFGFKKRKVKSDKSEEKNSVKIE